MLLLLNIKMKNIHGKIINIKIKNSGYKLQLVMLGLLYRY